MRNDYLSTRFFRPVPTIHANLRPHFGSRDEQGMPRKAGPGYAIGGKAETDSTASFPSVYRRVFPNTAIWEINSIQREAPA